MLITRMRWKVLYCSSKANDNSSKHYALKTLKYPKQLKELFLLKNDLIGRLKVLNFRKVKNSLQN